MTDSYPLSDPCAPIPWIRKEIEKQNITFDLGPGPNPIPSAKHRLDHVPYEGVTEVRNLELGALYLYGFVHCRHVIEDLNNTTHLLQEMQMADRVYIETPSPVHELNKREGPYRGYFHHRWFVWVADGVLNLLPKFSVIEYMEVSLPKEIPIEYANTYFLSDTPFKYKVWRYDLDFNIYNYGDILTQAIKDSAESTTRFLDGIRRDNLL